MAFYLVQFNEIHLAIYINRVYSRLTNFPSWAGFAVAVEPRAGPPRLSLVGQRFYWRLRSCTPAAARPGPCGARCPVLGGYGRRSPSLSTVVRGADTCLPCWPQPRAPLVRKMTNAARGRWFRLGRANFKISDPDPCKPRFSYFSVQ